MKEIWKSVKDFDGMYEVSNLGNVRSVDREKIQWNRYKNTKRFYKGTLLKQHNLKGYNAVSMWKKGKMYNLQVHRLVAKAFLKNPNNYPCVNHIDGNKKNNKLNNLEWCTYSHNTKEAYRLGLKVIGEKQKNQIKQLGLKSGKKVVQKDMLGNIINIFDSGRQASLKLGISQGNISMCCNGIRKSTGNYLFEYLKVGEKYE